MTHWSCLALFAAVLFAGDRLVATMAEQVVRNSGNTFVKMYEGKSSADTVVLGDSRADRDIDCSHIERIAGGRCVNLGLGGNSVLVSEVLLHDFVQRYGPPARVIVEVSHTTVEPETLGEMRIFSYASPKMKKLAAASAPTYAAFESVFHSLRFNDPAFWRLTAEAFSAPSTRLLTNKLPQEIADKWKDGGRVDRPIYRKNMEALGRLVTYADSLDVKTTLVICPSWGDFRRSIVNFDDWKAALQDAVGKRPLFDYSDAFGERADYFNDELHLNGEGARQFVALLASDRRF